MVNGIKSYYSTSGSYQADWGVFGNGTYNGTNTSSFGQNNVGLIQNLQAYVYWSGTEFAPDTRGAWLFHANVGNQFAGGKVSAAYAWAVRPGDVAAADSPSIPEPGSLTLVGLGLVGLGWARRRRG